MANKVKLLDKKRSLIALILGIILAIVAGLLSTSFDGGSVSSRGMSLAFGLGFGLIGGALGSLYRIKQLEKTPGKSKQMEIEYHDERNELIRVKASAKAGEFSNWGVLGIAYVCILIDTPIWLVFLLLGVFLLKYIIWIVFMNKYNKEL